MAGRGRPDLGAGPEADVWGRAGPGRAVGAEHAQQKRGARGSAFRVRSAQARTRVLRGQGQGRGAKEEFSGDPGVVSFGQLLQFPSFD